MAIRERKGRCLLNILTLLFATALGLSVWDSTTYGHGRALVVFRCDDFSPWFDLSVGRAFTNVCAKGHFPIHLAVVPASEKGAHAGAYAPLATELTAFLAEGVRSNHFEVSMHGLLHERMPDGTATEFGSLSLQEQSRRMQTGALIMREKYGLEPVAFVPPWHAWDPATLEAMRQVGISTLSGGRSAPLEWESHLGSTNRSVNYLPAFARLSSIHTLAKLAADSGDPNALAMLMAHPGDFKHWQGQDFLDFFDRLRSIPGVQIVSMRDVLAIEPGYTLGHCFALLHAREVFGRRRTWMKRLGLDIDTALPSGVYSSPTHLRNLTRSYWIRLTTFWLAVAWTLYGFAWALLLSRNKSAHEKSDLPQDNGLKNRSAPLRPHPLPRHSTSESA